VDIKWLESNGMAALLGSGRILTKPIGGVSGNSTANRMAGETDSRIEWSNARAQIMKRVVVNGALGMKLAKTKKAVDLVDAKGRKLGTFTPEPICPWDPTLTSEELDRRARGRGRPLGEILKRLGAE
jgi:hypothetical protein